MSKIMMSKFFKRNLIGDFSDDGNHFIGYEYATIAGTIRISYLRHGGRVYISSHGYDLLRGDLTYNELCEKCPSYLQLDMYNGVEAGEVDLEKLVHVMNSFANELVEAKKTIEAVDENAIVDYVNNYNARLNEIKTIVKERLTIDYLVSIESDYERGELLKEYKRVMTAKEYTVDSFKSKGRSSMLDDIKCNRRYPIPYYLERHFFRK